MVSKSAISIRELWATKTFRIQVIAGIVLMLVAIPVAAMVFDTQEPVRFDVSGSGLLPIEVESGEQMIVMWKLTQPPRLGCTGDIRRILFDPRTRVQLAAYDRESVRTGESYSSDGYMRKTFLLPKVLPTGWVGYRSDLCYACNPLQKLISAARICYSTPELFFKVT